MKKFVIIGIMIFGIQNAYSQTYPSDFMNRVEFMNFLNKVNDGQKSSSETEAKVYVVEWGVSPNGYSADDNRLSIKSNRQEISYLDPVVNKRSLTRAMTYNLPGIKSRPNFSGVRVFSVNNKTYFYELKLILTSLNVNREKASQYNVANSSGKLFIYLKVTGSGQNIVYDIQKCQYFVNKKMVWSSDQ